MALLFSLLLAGGLPRVVPEAAATVEAEAEAEALSFFSRSSSAATPAWTRSGTRTHANVRSCVTQPPRISHARICM